MGTEVTQVLQVRFRTNDGQTVFWRWKRRVPRLGVLEVWFWFRWRDGDARGRSLIGKSVLIKPPFVWQILQISRCSIYYPTQIAPVGPSGLGSNPHTSCDFKWRIVHSRTNKRWWHGDGVTRCNDSCLYHIYRLIWLQIIWRITKGPYKFDNIHGFVLDGKSYRQG